MVHHHSYESVAHIVAHEKRCKKHENTCIVLPVFIIAESPPSSPTSLSGMKIPINMNITLIIIHHSRA